MNFVAVKCNNCQSTLYIIYCILCGWRVYPPPYPPPTGPTWPDQGPSNRPVDVFCAIVFSVQLPTCFFNDFDATWLDIGGQLGSMLELFSFFLPLESCSYLEVVLGAIFLRFRTTLEDRKPAFRIVNNRVWYTSAFST